MRPASLRDSSISLRSAKPIAFALFSVCLLFTYVDDARADPLIVTGGTATISNPAGFGIGGFNLLAPNFSAVAGGIPNSANGIAEIRGGIRSFPNVPLAGSVCVGGTCLNGYFSNATRLNFTLGAFSGPGVGFTDNTYFVSVPFTMTGNLQLTEPILGPPPIPVLFTTEIAGDGYAGITFTRNFDTYIITRVVYDFGATQPLPEPATMLLFGTGVAGVIGAARRRRRTRSS